MNAAERLFAESQLRSLELRLSDIHKPRFVLNEQSMLREAKLLVLDEVSMVGDDMARDLLAFGKPILVLGDPGQLPPVRGEGAFTQCQPDVMLTEIHRQAGESAIIRLATLARESKSIPYGAHDEFVWKMRRLDVAPEQMLRGGQVICGRNATRLQLNLGMKRASGFDGVYPTGQGEKIICLKNRNDLGLVNGMFLDLTEVKDEDDISFTAVVTTEDGQKIGGTNGARERFRIYKGYFDDHVTPDPERERRDHWKKKTIIEAVWGWAITCHKAQGSQWENIIVYDDGLGRTAEDRARWLYTAITRAERGLVLLD
jgi:exodeoxyribonuclease-5